MTSKGSGAFQAACIGQEMARAQLPAIRIEVIDTLQVSMVHGWVAIEAARAASRTKGTFLARYSRITRRRGPNKAAVAIAHTILVSAWHMAVTGETYRDLGDDFYNQRRDPAQRVTTTSAKLETAGHTVTLTPAA